MKIFMGYKINLKDFPQLDAKRAVFLVEYFKDYNARNAAERAGLDPDNGHKMLRDAAVKEAMDEVVQQALDDLHVDAQWVLEEAVHNHRLARQKGNLSASNKALELIAKHISVDAIAKTKVEVDMVSDEKIADRLRQGRVRARIEKIREDSEPKPSSPTDEVDFL